MPMKLKSGLFRSLVISVLLYNAGCWPMRKNNTYAVEGLVYRCLHHVIRIEEGSPDQLEDHPSRSEVFGVTASPHMEKLAREKHASLDGTLPPYERSTASTHDNSTQ